MAKKTNKTNHARRKLLKQMAIGSGAITGFYLLPKKWTTPIIDSIIIPAHAQTSNPEVTFDINCTAGVPSEGAQCSTIAQSFILDGSVSASDGRDMTGVPLNVAYRGAIQAGGFGVDTFTISTDPGNTFSLTGVAEPPAGQLWATPNNSITVVFTDQAAFGTATCSQTGSCISGVEN